MIYVTIRSSLLVISPPIYMRKRYMHFLKKKKKEKTCARYFKYFWCFTTKKVLSIGANALRYFHYIDILLTIGVSRQSDRVFRVIYIGIIRTDQWGRAVWTYHTIIFIIKMYVRRSIHEHSQLDYILGSPLHHDISPDLFCTLLLSLLITVTIIVVVIHNI